MSDEDASGHRQFAVETFNSAWDQIEKPNRSSDEDLDLLLTAAASRWH